MKDIAFKAVGVGSVGTFCCIALFLTGDNEPLFLQIKQALHSVLERLGGNLEYKGPQGRRVVQGQQMMQAASDIFLGYTKDEDSGREFYVRTLKNHRLGSISEISEGEALSDYARLCGRTLARAHARSGDPAAIAGYSRQERGTRRCDRFVRDGLCRPDHPRSRRSREGKNPGEIGQSGKGRLVTPPTAGIRW